MDAILYELRSPGYQTIVICFETWDATEEDEEPRHWTQGTENIEAFLQEGDVVGVWTARGQEVEGFAEHEVAHYVETEVFEELRGVEGFSIRL